MTKTILIVDDEPAILVALKTRLAACGYCVVTAKSGAGGLDAATENAPDLIILDIRLPDIDGFEVFAKLRLAPSLSRVPVIFMSAHADAAARAHTVDDDRTRFVRKPYNACELMETVRAALESDTDVSAQNAA